MKRSQFYALYGPPTVYQRVASILAPALLLGLCVYLAVMWYTLPAEIPTNYDFDGTPTGWGSKVTLFVMPAIGFAILGILAIAERFPNSWNTGVRVTERNRAVVYHCTRDLMADVKLTMALIFTLYSIGFLYFPEKTLWLTIGDLVLIGIPLLRYFIRVLRVR